MVKKKNILGHPKASLPPAAAAADLSALVVEGEVALEAQGRRGRVQKGRGDLGRSVLAVAAGEPGSRLRLVGSWWFSVGKFFGLERGLGF